MPDPHPQAARPLPGPARTLGTFDVVCIVVGLVVGAGIFKAPALVAANSSSGGEMLAFWLAGGFLALVGALCYAELASTYPSAGGDYHFLQRAFGRDPACLFAWSRAAVMQTGSIAILAYVFGDYASAVLPVGPASPALYAAAVIVLFTAINLAGLREGRNAQMLFTALELGGLLLVAVAGLALAGAAVPSPAEAAPPAAPASAAVGLAMVFVLLTYGGWNEAAYVSAELRGSRRSIAWALGLSVAAVTAIYLLVNVAYLRTLGLHGMARSEAVAADVVARAFGASGEWIVSAIVAVSALTSLNATIITGARCNYAVGRDFRLFRFLGSWHPRSNAPANALLLQAVVALALVCLGAATRSGFGTLVEYTAPVFWLFFVLTGLALVRLRRLEPGIERPFRVPLYPLTPALFCASGAYMLWSSLRYTGVGAAAGAGVLALGLPVLWLARRSESRAPVPTRQE